MDDKHSELTGSGRRSWCWRATMATGQLLVVVGRKSEWAISAGSHDAIAHRRPIKPESGYNQVRSSAPTVGRRVVDLCDSSWRKATAKQVEFSVQYRAPRSSYRDWDV